MDTTNFTTQLKTVCSSAQFWIIENGSTDVRRQADQFSSGGKWRILLYRIRGNWDIFSPNKTTKMNIKGFLYILLLFFTLGGKLLTVVSRVSVQTISGNVSQDHHERREETFNRFG